MQAHGIAVRTTVAGTGILLPSDKVRHSVNIVCKVKVIRF